MCRFLGVRIVRSAQGLKASKALLVARWSVSRPCAVFWGRAGPSEPRTQDEALAGGQGKSEDKGPPVPFRVRRPCASSRGAGPRNRPSGPRPRSAPPACPPLWRVPLFGVNGVRTPAGLRACAPQGAPRPGVRPPGCEGQTCHPACHAPLGRALQGAVHGRGIDHQVRSRHTLTIRAVPPVPSRVPSPCTGLS